MRQSPKKPEEIDDPKKVKKYETQMAELREEITVADNTIDKLKQQRKKLPKHITFDQLSEDDKFKQLATLAQIICDNLNDTEVKFPGTDMKIFINWYQRKIAEVRRSESI